MIVRDDITVRADNDARTKALLQPVLWNAALAGDAEEVMEHRVVEELRHLVSHLLAGLDIHDGGGRLPDYRGVAHPQLCIAVDGRRVDVQFERRTVRGLVLATTRRPAGSGEGQHDACQ